MKNESMKNMFKLSFGEEIGNAVSHGVMAVLFLFALPMVAVYAYIKYGIIGSITESLYVICIFLMFIGSCIYHSMEFESTQKYIMRKLDHCFIYVAIAGTYTPVLALIVDKPMSYILLAAQWIATICGILLTSISKNNHKVLSMTIYMVMGWCAVMIIPTIFNHGIAFFSLILLGGIFYTVGAIFYAKKFPYAHFVWHIFILLASISHFIAIVFFL